MGICSQVCSGYRSFVLPLAILLLIIVLTMLVSAPALAARTVNSVTLNGVSSVSVAADEAVSAVVNVTTGGTGNGKHWKSTAWLISTTSVGTYTCVNHGNYVHSGTYQETFDVTAPSGAGTYDAYFVAYRDDGCSRDGSGLFTLSDSVVVGSSCPNQTVADNFDIESYSQNSGTQNWSGSWVEIGESDGTSAGIARVRNDLCSSGNCLRLGVPSESSAETFAGVGVSREVDLSGATAATLTYNYRSGVNQNSETVLLQASANGGSSWTTLRTYNVTSTNLSATAESVDLTSYIAGNTRIRFIASGTDAVVGLYIDDLEISYEDCSYDSRADWHFDESSWNTTANEIVDSSGNDYHGASAYLADTVSGKICQAADLSSNGTTDYLALDHRALDGLGDFTFSVWIKTSATSTQQEIIQALGSDADDDEFEIALEGSNSIFVKIRDDSRWFSLSTNELTSGGWKHLAITRSGSQGCLYIDGSLKSCQSGYPTGNLDIQSGTLLMGQEQDSFAGSFDASQDFEGEIDEPLIIAQALSASQVQDIYSNQNAGHNWDGSSRACPVAVVDHLAIETGAGSASTCVAKAITIKACADSSCSSLVTDYSGTVSLSTSSSHGDWSLSTAAGTLSPSPDSDDNGAVSYSFTSSDAGDAVLGLSNVHADDLTIRAEDSANGLITTSSAVSFRDNAFVIEDADAISGDNIVVAGRDHAYRVTLYQRDSSLVPPTCAVPAGYTGNKNLRGWITRHTDDPAGAAPSVGATALPDAVPAGGDYLTLGFTAGAADFLLSTSDVGKYALNLRDDSASFATTTIDGSSADQVVRPFGFGFSNIRSGATANGGGSGAATDAVLAAAATDFVGTVGAYLHHSDDDGDDDGVPDDGADITNNGLTVSFSGAASLSIVSHTPASGDVGSWSPASVPLVNGVRTDQTMRYGEVGSLVVKADLEDYLSTAGADITGQSPVIGRFIPARLDVGLVVPPVFSDNCSAFSHMDRALTYATSPQLQVVAYNAVGTITRNYGSDYWKLDDDPAGRTYSNAASGATASISSVLASSASSDWWNTTHSNYDGQATLTITGDTVTYGRTALQEPFFALVDLQLAVADLTDTDGVCYKIDTNNNGNYSEESCAGYTVAGITGTELRFGRLLINNAYGPETEDLTVEARTEYWNGAAFEINGLDDCTGLSIDTDPIGPSNITVGGGTTDLNGGSSSTSASAGVLGIDFSAPGAENTGEVQVRLYAPGQAVSSGVSSMPWLLYDWDEDGDYDDDPGARTATFGRYRGHDRVIYWRESFSN